MTPPSPPTLHITLPLPPSVNHCYINVGIGRRKLSPKAEAWMTEAGYTIKSACRSCGWSMSTDRKLIMELWVFWPDRKRRDTHNLHKLLADAPEGIAYGDDRYVLMRDMDFDYDKGNPRVEVQIREA